ncbi:hypothetical protein P4482_03175 [Neobacillus thermocopriae]|uniref:hypothetical protein n=1 Tax=Neobacillus thermocopriae TaxID=1215031 RepID=UPI002E1D7FE4|nr:hypothetical protein [Neobacillus thermocopriae]MED3713219.1 hypothetical protein [Neobacillus thermocopriae]
MSVADTLFSFIAVILFGSIPTLIVATTFLVLDPFRIRYLLDFQVYLAWQPMHIFHPIGYKLELVLLPLKLYQPYQY